MRIKRPALIGRLQSKLLDGIKLPIGRLFEANGRLYLLVSGYRYEKDEEFLVFFYIYNLIASSPHRLT